MDHPRIVLTGASSGLGRLAAIALARRGARLSLIARDPTRMAETVELIRAASPEAEVDVNLADFSSISQTEQLGRDLAATHPVVDVLIANAGIHAFAPRVTSEGLPEMVAVNYLSPWVLSRALMPSLLRATHPRVVVVASEASRHHGVVRLPDDLTRVQPFTRRGSSAHYGRTKLFDVMFARTLARRVGDTDLATIAVDPGFNVTGLGRELPGAGAAKRLLTALRVGDPRIGAGLIVEAAVGSEFANRSGQYWTARGPRRIEPTPIADDLAMQDRLWTETERLLDSLRSVE